MCCGAKYCRFVSARGEGLCLKQDKSSFNRASENLMQAPPLISLRAILAGRLGWLRHVAQLGVLITFAAAFVVFSLLRPSTFPTLDNMRIVLNTSAEAIVVAVAVTVPLVMNDFDLSFGSMMGLANGLVVVLMAKNGMPPGLAVPAVLVVGACAGLINGVAIAYLGGSSFIITLAMGSVLGGAEIAATNQETIFKGIPSSIKAFGTSGWEGLRSPFFMAVGLTLLLWFLMEATVLGRHMYAIGGSPETARLGGVNVRGTRTLGLIICAMMATIAGMLLVTTSAASYPAAGAPYLLPAFAGAFLGSTVFRKPQFSVPGAAIAVVLLEMIAAGLIQLNVARWSIDVMYGIVLIVAVLFAGFGRRLFQR